MKAIVTFLVVSTVLSVCYAVLREEHYSEEVKKHQRQWHDLCLTNSGTHEETLEEMRQGKFPEDPKLKQYIYCMVRNAGVVDKYGNAKLSYLAELEPPKWRESGKVLHATIASCEADVKNMIPLIDRFYKILQCFYAASPEHFFFP